MAELSVHSSAQQTKIAQAYESVLSTPARHYDFDAVMRRAPLKNMIAAMRAAFASPINAPPRMTYSVSGPQPQEATLLLMPAWREGGRIGIKVATVYPENPGRGLPSVNAQYLLFSTRTGTFEASLDGRALTVLRTAAVSALACDLMAAPQSKQMVLVGTGELAPYLARAHNLVRPLAVTVWGRTLARAELMARTLCAEGLTVDATEDLESAVRRADIISCATLSQAPLIHGDWLRAHAHVDLVGGFRPGMREADDEVVRRSKIVVDTRQALDECGDLALPLTDGVISTAQICSLSELLTGKANVDPGCITLFKSVGTAQADLAGADLVLGEVTPTSAYDEA